jgi:hypothetical protein
VERLWRDAKLLEIGGECHLYTLLVLKYLTSGTKISNGRTGGTNEAHHKNIVRDLSKLLGSASGIA